MSRFDEGIQDFVNVSIVLLFTFIGGYYLVASALKNASQKQATIGKRCLGLIVVDEKGQRISKKRALERLFAEYFISAFTFGLGCVAACFSKKKQTLHDKFTKTYVVVGKPQKVALPQGSSGKRAAKPALGQLRVPL